MGPKPAKGTGSGSSKKKAEIKKTDKIVEDKTFGLKNKKGAKTQKFVQTVQKQADEKVKQIKTGGVAAPKLSKKEIEKAKLDELNLLFKPVQQQQKVPDGVDPKSVLCTFFKSGGCQKGNKCKFSHDLTIEKKAAKRNMYDTENGEEAKDTMDDWTQEQLEEVVNKRHGASNAAKPKTSIICKHFLNAVEGSMYGWFWACPTGEKCIYKHALPPGYILKRDMKKDDEDDENKVSLEEHIENERAALTGALTPVTLETFLVWKKKKIDEKKRLHAAELAKKKKDFAKGNAVSGRDIFQFKPELADNDDDEAGDAFSYARRNDDGTIIDEDLQMRELNLESLALEASQVDETKITKAPMMSVKDRLAHTAHGAIAEDRLPPELMNGDDTGLPQATGGSDEQKQPVENGAAAAAAPSLDDVPIDESLFEDLDDLEDLDIDDDDDGDEE